ncbi:hypothetical protein [Streptomyces cinerochromogenes]|uniref:hypothetical protein n=1 Tax=Streptomyces cinerochromogenes TaxID=66422 RepID=UPI0033BF9817
MPSAPVLVVTVSERASSPPTPAYPERAAAQDSAPRDGTRPTAVTSAIQVPGRAVARAVQVAESRPRSIGR